MADTTQEVAYARLLGILLTDGCVSPKGNGWRIIVSNNAIAILDCFEQAVLSCFGESIRRFNRGKLHVGVLDSKRIGQFLIDAHGTFRTESCSSHQGCPFLRGGRKPCRVCNPLEVCATQYPPTSLPNLATVEEKAEFLKLAFSCDGGVNLYAAQRGTVSWLIRNVYLACKHPTLIHQYHQLLMNLDISSQVMLDDWRVLIQGRPAIQRFADIVGFLPGVTIGANSRYWMGVCKSDVLDKLLESYGNPRSILDLPMFSVTENLG